MNIRNIQKLIRLQLQLIKNNFMHLRSNSLAWNPHKMLGAPFQCSIFLVKGKNILHEANCSGAKYLFMQDKFYDVSWDTGDKSVQCGRKVRKKI